MALCKSPLRYPGGKTRAVKTLMQFLPSGVRRLCSPFVGGGSFELACAARGIDVRAYDSFLPLVNFWQMLLVSRDKLIDEVYRLHPLPAPQFYMLQKSYAAIYDSVFEAAVFFALNRASFSGTTFAGGMSPGHPRFTVSSIERLRQFDGHNFFVAAGDFRETIDAHAGDFLYLDPPYANGEALYGKRGNAHRDFDHFALYKKLSGRGDWILSYNDCHYIRALYADYEIVDVAWGYGMRRSRRSAEILILPRGATGLV